MTLAQFVFGFWDRAGLLTLIALAIISVPICIKITDSDDTRRLGIATAIVLPLAAIFCLVWLVRPISWSWAPVAVPLLADLYFLLAKLGHTGLADRRRARRQRRRDTPPPNDERDDDLTDDDLTDDDEVTVRVEDDVEPQSGPTRA